MHYGIDWDGPLPVHRADTEDYNSIDVPSNIIEINEQQRVQLNSLVQPLEKSDNYGIDLYMHAREFLQQVNIN